MLTYEDHASVTGTARLQGLNGWTIHVVSCSKTERWNFS